ncbi:nuclear transport factor 2 family protein [Herbaspirillum sp. HC18]|nr:nuclear transport factor 2 family protein [Herbaspirillum sp. HC18]
MSTDTMTPAQIVEAYLAAHMIPDPVAARAFIGPGFEITFTGGRKMKEPAQATAFNARRYKWVKKHFERTETVAGGTADETVVYSLGTLYGEWPDGTPFEGNRYIDRFVVSNGKIVRQSVWNDSAEILLDRAGLTPQDRL